MADSKSTNKKTGSKNNSDKKKSEKKSSKKVSTEFDEYKKTGKTRYSSINNEYDNQVFDTFNETPQSLKIKDEITIIGAILGAILMILSYFNVCGIVGTALNWILFGFMGFVAYFFPFIFIFFVVYLIYNRKNIVAKKKLTFCVISVLCLCSIIHLFTCYDTVTFWGSFKIGFVERTGGGLLGEFLAWPLCKLFGKIATVIILIVIMIVCFMMLTGKALLSIIGQASKDEYKELSRRNKEYRERKQKERYEENARILESGDYRKLKKRRPKVYAANIDDPAYTGEFTPRRTSRDSFLNRLKNEGVSPNNDQNSVNSDSNSNTKNQQDNITSETQNNFRIFDNKKKANNVVEETSNVNISGLDMVEITGSGLEVEQPKEVYKSELERKFGKNNQSDSSNNNRKSVDKYQDDISKNSYETNYVAQTEELYSDSDIQSMINNDTDIVSNVVEKTDDGSYSNFGRKNNEETIVTKNSDIFARGDYKEVKPTASSTHSIAGKQNEVVNSPANDGVKLVVVKQNKKPPKPYRFPPLNKLDCQTSSSKGTSKEELLETKNKLESTLKSFGVNVTINNISCGPSVTRYELQPEQGVKVSKITSLADDIKLNLAAADIRIEAPIPGKSAVGIEVPNKVNQMVTLGSIINSPEFKNSKSSLSFAVGRDIGGQVIVSDIKKMPHLLIAGATGSGKSVCINTLIMSIIYKSSPDDVKLILVDPKVVELSVYNGIPHLLIPVVTDPKKASGALNWAVMEMTDRYKKFADLGVRDIEGYNKRIDNQKEPEQSSSGEIYVKMPKIVIIIDELADLMMVAPGEVEEYICRLAQLARAAGIHLVIATQRPSVNVITGLIKANIPTRIAFSVSSQIDSRTILDMAGAEKLLGKGDMLFSSSSTPKPVRIQGAFVSDNEVLDVVDFLKSNNDNSYDSDVEDKLAKAMTAPSSGSNKATSDSSAGSDYDEYIYPAGVFIIQKEKASIGALQRQFKIGFNRAARIMDQLSEFNVVGPEEGTKPRQILMSLEQFEQFAGENGLK